MIKAVIFDMDGVIIDSEPLHDSASKLVFEKEYPTGSGNQIQHDLIAFRGRTERDFWAHMKTAYSLNPSAEELSIREEEHFFSLLQSEPDVLPMEGVVPFAELLRSRYPLALASSSSHVVISQVLSRLQMQALFDIVVSGDDVKYGKPAPDIFLLAAEKLGFEPHHCLVIEDSAHGVASAKAAGMSCIGFKGTPHNKHDLSLADRIIGSFHMTQTSQIEDIIDLKIQK